MRRAPIVLTFTVLGTAGVLLFKPLTTTAAAGSTAASPSTPSSSSPSSSTASSSTPSDEPTSTPSTGSSTSTGAKDGTYTGAAETTRFGTTQVKVTIAGSKITEVTVVQLNQDDPRSTQISESAAPV
jgi:uncharacterized protein with FMN-binding domain